MGIYSVYLATFNYLADVYHRYASSALAAQSCCRNVVGAVFPLISSPLFNNLGFAQASSLLGGIVSFHFSHPLSFLESSDGAAFSSVSLVSHLMHSHFYSLHDVNTYRRQ